MTPTPGPTLTPTATPTVASIGPCGTAAIGNNVSTQVWLGWPVPLNYLLIQNVTPLSGGCDVYCGLGTKNNVSVNGGTLLTPHGGAWLPAPPIPVNTDLACIADGCMAKVQVCWW
jgi:hypothetical protein